MPDIRTKANMTAAFDTFIEFAESPTGALGVNPVRRVFADAKSGRKFTFQYLADCPDLTCPDLTCPDLTCPDLTCPDLTSPDWTCPEIPA